MRESLENIRSRCTDPEFTKKFNQLFSLSTLLRDCIIGPDYDLSKKEIPTISLTTYGDKTFKLLKRKFKNVDERIIKVSLFIDFYHEELFVDIISTDIDPIEKFINGQIATSEILFPWAYGRLLYDKFYVEFDEPENLLENPDVIRFLKETPQGVFQLGEYTTGPLGLIKNNPSRLIRPLRKLNLWHCSDPSCAKFHSVTLSTASSIVSQILDAVEELLSTEKLSAWGDFYYESCLTQDVYYDSDRIDLIPIMLINAFGYNELKCLLIEIIDSNHGFRSLLPNTKLFKGASKAIAQNLSKEACFQTLLLCDDIQLIISLEKLIDNKTIIVPSTEIRKGKNISHQGFYGIYHECNKLGVRSVSSRASLGFVRLNNLLQDVYSEASIRQQLEWNLRFYEEDSLLEKLEAYILKEEPQKIIKDTILSGPLQISKTFKALIGSFKMPNTIEEESALVDKILWKLGFDVNIYPTILQKFWEQLEVFKTTTISCGLINENDKEKIRSAAVNFWISLEEVLEHSLSFITWAILSDHYLHTQFKYNFEDARNFMCEKLDGVIIGSNDPLLFDNNGKNTLFPLTEGFTALLKICDDLISQGHDKYKRPEQEMPSFYNKAKLTSFPFESKIFLFDIKAKDLSRLRELLNSIPLEFAKNKVLAIRNRTQHKRDDFPSQDEILNASNCVQTVVNKIEHSGIFPNVYLFKCSQTDKFGRVFYEYEDYKKRSVILKSALQFVGSKVPLSKKYPLVILPIVGIGNSQEPLRFIFEENSSYLQFWKNFPRKKIRKIDTKNNLIAPEMSSSIAT